jgi:hypothetical protein
MASWSRLEERDGVWTIVAPPLRGLDQQLLQNLQAVTGVRLEAEDLESPAEVVDLFTRERLHEAST